MEFLVYFELDKWTEVSIFKVKISGDRYETYACIPKSQTKDKIFHII